MISYGKQSLDKSDIDIVTKALKSKWLTQGPYVGVFEKALNDFFGSKNACAVSNGTAALHLAGLALGWKAKDIIITSPITFLASANAIIYNGAIPDFVDIDNKTYTIDLNKLEDKIKNYNKSGKKIKAVVGVDYAGHPCNWKDLRKMADKYQFQLINDNCHAMGASYFKSNKYAVEYADIVTQSYHPVKNITTGEGGAVLTNNNRIDKKIKQLRTHGMTKEINELEKNDGPWYYEMHDLGYNYRITDFQCALGVSQLKKLSNFINLRKGIAKKYDKSFSSFSNLTVPYVNENSGHAYHLYPLKIDFDNLSINKSDFFKELKKSNILLQVHYIPVHIQPYYRKNFGFSYGDFPISEKFYSEEISLPIYPDLSNEDQCFVIDQITKLIE